MIFFGHSLTEMDLFWIQVSLACWPIGWLAYFLEGLSDLEGE